MKYRYAACMFMAAFLLQTTLANVFSVFGATPNLLLCLVAVFSFLYDGDNYGIVFGVAFGLLYDACFSEYTGIAALAFLGISLSIMLVKVVMNREAIISVMIVSAAATVAYALIYWGIMAMLGSSYSFFYAMRKLPLYVLYNTAVVAILYRLMIRRVVKHHYDKHFNGVMQYIGRGRL